MRILPVFTLFIMMVSCKTIKEDINQTVPYKGTVILLGKVDKNGLQQEPFNQWFQPNFDEYKVNDSLVNQLKPLMKDIEIKAFMGTWCSDSKRETPHFYKILEAVDFNPNHFTLYAVDREKSTPQQAEKDLNITNVPTFIFYKNGKEINRIVEYPIETLEQDMLKILKGDNYKHAYAE